MTPEDEQRVKVQLIVKKHFVKTRTVWRGPVSRDSELPVPGSIQEPYILDCRAVAIFLFWVTDPWQHLIIGNGIFLPHSKHKYIITCVCVCVCVCVCALSRSVMSDTLQPILSPTRLLCPWGFSRQEYWSGLPCPPPGHLPNLGIQPRSPELQADSLPFQSPGRPINTGVGSLSILQGIFPTRESSQGLLH